MESIPCSLKHRDLTEKIIGTFYDVYNELGHGFLESVYEQALASALAQAGMCFLNSKRPVVSIKRMKSSYSITCALPISR